MLQTLKDNLAKDILKKLKYEIIFQESKIDGVDISAPLFRLSKEHNKKIIDIFNEIKKVLVKNKDFTQITFSNGFLNIILNREKFTKELFKNSKKITKPFKSNKKTVAIDYSSPNIAKSFSVGHLRSTVIGNALKNIYKFLGYNVVSINYLGDWGTQFGNLISGFKMWKKEYDIKNLDLNMLQDIYQRYHSELKDNLDLVEKGRKEFLKLEKADKENLALWEEIRKISLVDFNKTYDLLGVKYDSYDGEAYYNDKLLDIVKDLENKKILKEDQGAKVVHLSSDMPPAIMIKSDNSSSYILRDLAALKDRKNRFRADKVLYVVGSEQKLHFTQLKMISDILGYNVEVEHIPFGLILKDGKKMSTRKGTGTPLNEVISNAISHAKKEIEEKNPNLKEKDEIAKKVAISALIFFNLKNEKHLDISFDLNEMLSFQGATGAYLQYTLVRIKSILDELKILDITKLKKISYENVSLDHYFTIIKMLSDFKEVVRKSQEENAPDIISKYAISLSQEFNKFYAKEKIITNDHKKSQLNNALLIMVYDILKKAMELLGLFIVDKM